MIDTLNIDTMEYDFIRGKMIFNLKEFVMHNSKRTKSSEEPIQLFRKIQLPQRRRYFRGGKTTISEIQMFAIPIR